MRDSWRGRSDRNLELIIWLFSITYPRRIQANLPRRNNNQRQAQDWCRARGLTTAVVALRGVALYFEFDTNHFCSLFKELGMSSVSNGKVLMVQQSQVSLRILASQTMQLIVSILQNLAKRHLLLTMEVDTALISSPRKQATTLFIRSAMITVRCFWAETSIPEISGWLLIRERWSRNQT